MPKRITLESTEPSYVHKILILVWLILMVIAWILIVAAISLPSWVTGQNVKVTNGVTVLNSDIEVGLFKQCATNNLVSSGSTCSSISPDDSTISAWKAASAFFIIGLIFLFVTIVLAIFSICKYRIVPWAKVLMSFANLFLIIAAVLVPIGFAWLDDKCPNSSAGQCGLNCADTTGRMGFFSLCGPFEVSSATFLMFAGEVILFISALFAACVRIHTVVYSEA